VSGGANYGLAFPATAGFAYVKLLDRGSLPTRTAWDLPPLF